MDNPDAFVPAKTRRKRFFSFNTFAQTPVGSPHGKRTPPSSKGSARKQLTFGLEPEPNGTSAGEGAKGHASKGLKQATNSALPSPNEHKSTTTSTNVPEPRPVSQKVSTTTTTSSSSSSTSSNLSRVNSSSGPQQSVWGIPGSRTLNTAAQPSQTRSQKPQKTTTTQHAQSTTQSAPESAPPTAQPTTTQPSTQPSTATQPQPTAQPAQPTQSIATQHQAQKQKQQPRARAPSPSPEPQPSHLTPLWLCFLDNPEHYLPDLTPPFAQHPHYPPQWTQPLQHQRRPHEHFERKQNNRRPDQRPAVPPDSSLPSHPSAPSHPTRAKLFKKKNKKSSSNPTPAQQQPGEAADSAQVPSQKQSRIQKRRILEREQQRRVLQLLTQLAKTVVEPLVPERPRSQSLSVANNHPPKNRSLTDVFERPDLLATLVKNRPTAQSLPPLFPRPEQGQAPVTPQKTPSRPIPATPQSPPQSSVQATVQQLLTLKIQQEEQKGIEQELQYKLRAQLIKQKRKMKNKFKRERAKKNAEEKQSGAKNDADAQNDSDDDSDAEIDAEAKNDTAVKKGPTAAAKGPSPKAVAKGSSPTAVAKPSPKGPTPTAVVKGPSPKGPAPMAAPNGPSPAAASNDPLTPKVTTPSKLRVDAPLFVWESKDVKSREETTIRPKAGSVQPSPSSSSSSSHPSSTARLTAYRPPNSEPRNSLDGTEAKGQRLVASEPRLTSVGRRIFATPPRHTKHYPADVDASSGFSSSGSGSDYGEKQLDSLRTNRSTSPSLGRPLPTLTRPNRSQSEAAPGTPQKPLATVSSPLSRSSMSPNPALSPSPIKWGYILRPRSHTESEIDYPPQLRRGRTPLVALPSSYSFTNSSKTPDRLRVSPNNSSELPIR